LYVITFYSFKGGVGRTMALVNVAAELVRQGQKVLVVDFDLEAPGLETYCHLQPPQPHPGIVEYVAEFRRRHQVPKLGDFIYEANPLGKKGGRLWVMPAGRRDSVYRSALANLDWQRLYDEQGGFYLFEDTKKGWEEELKVDYVLIDSRTGDTDVLGICTRQLPDSVVLMFTPNEQNLAGLENVCRDIRSEKTEGLKKDIRFHFVASNVPDLDDEDRHLRRHINQFRARLQIRHAPVPIIHRNETLQMLDQPVFVFQRPRSQLAREYRFLVRALQIQNPEDREGALLFLKEIQKDHSRLLDWSEYAWNRSAMLLRKRPEDEDALTQSPKRYVPHPVRESVNRYTHQFWDDPEVLFRIGQYLLRYNEPDMALRRLNRVLELQPDLAEAVLKRAFCYRQLRDNARATEDLLGYLRDHGTQTSPGWSVAFGSEDLLGLDAPDVESARKIRAWLKRNDTALLELLSISAEAFLKTLDLPPVQIPSGNTSHDASWLLYTVIFRLIQQQRWDDAIRCLEHPTVRHLIETGRRDPADTWKSSHAFFLAVAHWGKLEKPDREICSQALLTFQPVLEWTQGENLDTIWFQKLALLHWGAGDTKKATDALDQALDTLDETGEVIDGVSYWSFQETTPREYRQDCEEMRRMIRGEAVQPAFLTPRR
jgi:MinD-like ATPase involved in chromosome partitioning or flagellar assembly